MKLFTRSISVITLIGILTFTSVAEARLGGGRSMGSRGFRGFGGGAPRSFQSNPRFQQPLPHSVPPQQQANRPMGAFGTPPSMGGSFTRGLLGGLAGGFIGSMLFRNSGHAGMGMGDYEGGSRGGIGIFEILILLGLIYLVYRMFMQRKYASSGNTHYSAMNPYDKLRSIEPGPYKQSDQNDLSGTGNPYFNGSQYANGSQSTEGSTELSWAEQLRQYDSNFDLSTFKEQRMDDFMLLQAAWGQRNLSGISGIVSPEILQEFSRDIDDLVKKGQINRIENIAVRGTELVESWAERGKEYATVRFRANLTDYTVSENTGEVLAGSKTQPVKFDESWTFVRNIDSVDSRSNPWKLSAIEQ